MIIIQKNVYKQIQEKIIVIVIEWIFGILCPIIALFTLIAHIPYKKKEANKEK